MSEAVNKCTHHAEIRRLFDMVILEMGIVCPYCLIAELTKELDGLRRFKASVDEALNSGDGSYRP